MRPHEISEESVISTLRESDQLLPSIKSRYNALKQAGDRINIPGGSGSYVGYHSIAEKTFSRMSETRTEYDKEADALYIVLRDVPASDSKDLEDGITIDLDGEGHIVGLEVLDASERLGLEALLNISIENMPLEKIPGTAAT